MNCLKTNTQNPFQIDFHFKRTHAKPMVMACFPFPPKKNEQTVSESCVCLFCWGTGKYIHIHPKRQSFRRKKTIKCFPCFVYTSITKSSSGWRYIYYMLSGMLFKFRITFKFECWAKLGPTRANLTRISVKIRAHLARISATYRQFLFKQTVSTTKSNTK